MNMIDTLARAIAKTAIGADVWDRMALTQRAMFRAQARAALEALLEPTEGMMKAGLYQSFRNMPLLDQWKTMIRAALEEKA